MTLRDVRFAAVRRCCARLVGRVRGAGVASGDDSGTAIVEFIFVALVIMAPLVYLIVAVADLQRSQLAVSQAARNAGRAYATSDNPVQARVRVAAAVRLAMADQHLPDDASWRYVDAGEDCNDAHVHTITPSLTAGAEFAICVSRRATLPGVPSVLAGKRIATNAEYVVHIDDFRADRQAGR